LTLRVGDIVEVTDRSNEDSGWFQGTSKGKLGVFPVVVVAAITTTPVAPPPPMTTNPMVTTGSALPPQPKAPQPTQPTQPTQPPKQTPPAVPQYDAAPTPINTGTTVNEQTIRRKRQTLVCLYAHYSGLLSSTFYAITGLILLCWGVLNRSPSPVFPDTYRTYHWYDALIGAWAMAAGFGMVCFEVGYGKFRSASTRIPWRAFLYIFVGVPGVVSFPTGVGGGMMLIPALANFYSAFLGETFKQAPTPQKTKEQKLEAYEEDLTSFEWLLIKVGGKNPDRQVGRVFFLLIYVAANLAAGILHLIDSYQGIQDAKEFNRINRITPTTPPTPDKDFPTYWVPAAKFFGNMLNLNYSIILLPVSHSLMRWLVDHSLGRTGISKLFKAILFIIPVDDAINIHKLIAYTGFVAAIGHTVCHCMNYVQKATYVINLYGYSIFVTGPILIACIFILYPATKLDVKRGHFEIFWYTHMMYFVLFVTTLIHGRGVWGPNYWKWFIGPGTIYVLERIYREVVTRKPVKVISVTFMSNQVISLLLEKSGALENYVEGQYAYICCPSISSLQWHPFTISSAPKEPYVSFHIRVQGKGSWTFRLREFFRVLASGTTKSTVRLAHMEDGDIRPGLIEGPNGQPLLRIHGPYSAPTQRLADYNDVMICASGIGVTPLASALKSIVHFRWRYATNSAFPDKATFVWVVAHKEISSFRWLCRTIRESNDAIVNLRAKGSDNYRRQLKFRIYITSYSQAEAEKFTRMKDDEQGYDDTGLWGLPYGQGENVEKTTSGLTEMEIYSAMMAPQKGTVNLGNFIEITLGRPNWEQIFADVQSTTTQEDIGVTFCGNPLIGKDLKKNCLVYSLRGNKNTRFHLHQEIF
jgi:NADPH oxidase